MSVLLTALKLAKKGGKLLSPAAKKAIELAKNQASKEGKAIKDVIVPGAVKGVKGAAEAVKTQAPKVAKKVKTRVKSAAQKVKGKVLEKRGQKVFTYNKKKKRN